MPRPLTAADLPSFLSFSPDDPGFTCILPLARRDLRRCRNVVHKDDNIEASALRNLLLDQNSSGAAKYTHLQRYLELCLCRRSHRADTVSTDLAPAVCKRWQSELSGCCETKHRERPETPDSKCDVLNSDNDLSESSPPVNAVLWQNEDRKPKGNISSPICNSKSRQTTQDGHLSCVEGFQPYKKPPKDTIYAKIQKPLTKNDRIAGALYLFTRDSSPGVVKIGLTTRTVAERMKAWQWMCHYIPRVQHEIRSVPHVYRAELLVHLELADFWRRETKCKHNPECLTRHKEWFQVDVERAQEVMNKWTQWLQLARPYHADGSLRSEWVDICNKFQAQSKPITAEALLGMMPTHAENMEDTKSPRLAGEESDAEAKRAVTPKPAAASRANPTKRSFQRSATYCPDSECCAGRRAR